MGYTHYDVFVIGTGSAGQQVAEACAKEGMNVAVADAREYGGTCPNRGCDPKKVLVNASELIGRTSDMAAVGITDTVQINWEALQTFKKKFVSAVPIRTEEDFKKLGITMYHQSPEFLSENMLTVEGKKITFDKIVIATGRIPRPLDFKGSYLLSVSDDFLDLPSLPKSMIFIGAGYIALEFAHIAARCGVDVTIVEQGDRILSIMDSTLTDHLLEVSKCIGINFIFDATTSQIEELRKNKRLHYTQNGEEKSVKARVIFNTTGRVPATKALNLDKGTIAFSEKGVTVNEYLQSTTNKNVYACGDVADSGALPLTPLSGLEGKHVAEQILKNTHKKYTFSVIPTAVFTYPQVASVGISEKQAKEKGISYTVKEGFVPERFSTKRMNAQAYYYKTIIDSDTDTILGTSILAPEASEMIDIFSLAIHHKMTRTAFRETIFTYPSFGSDTLSMV